MDSLARSRKDNTSSATISKSMHPQEFNNSRKM